MMQVYNIACIVAEVDEAQQLPAESGSHQEDAGSGQFGPRGAEP